MNYSDREIEALAQWAMSPDPVNCELFNSQPLEERLRAFDWWWERWEDAEFKSDNWTCDNGSMNFISNYYFLDLEICLRLSLDCFFHLDIYDCNVNDVHDYYENGINNTDDLPLDRIKADIYNAIKNHITNE
jgi:hypothetical protein